MSHHTEGVGHTQNHRDYAQTVHNFPETSFGQNRLTLEDLGFKSQNLLSDKLSPRSNNTGFNNSKTIKRLS